MKDGFEAAKKAFLENDGCTQLPVQGPKVGKTVFTGQVTRDGKPKTSSVVEIIVDGKVAAYFITTHPVRAFAVDNDA